ncbi:MAG: polysaccharide biosynthesis tyrosine autokinase [Burkholderiales bacterium]|nr:polysaccharide biosynthesis tyrosine autokinase [Burkholderiales bacterium]
MNRMDFQIDELPTSDDASDKRIGMQLVQLGRLLKSDIPAVEAVQRKKRLRFGEAAVKLGLVNRQDVDDALARQYDFPAPPAWAHGAEVVIATPSSVGQPVAESIRTLRAQLALQWMSQPQVQFLAVVSAARGEGRSFIAANLAVAFAQLHERTLLIDMDLRNARQHKIFHVDNRHGLSTLVSGRGTGTEIQRVVGYDSLGVLPSGPRAPHPQELLTSRSMSPVLEHVRQRYDVVIVDTPAFACGADAQIVSAQTRQVLLVSAPGGATRDETERLVGACRQVGASVAGAVVNSR